MKAGCIGIACKEYKMSLIFLGIHNFRQTLTLKPTPPAGTASHMSRLPVISMTLQGLLAHVLLRYL